MANTDKQNFRYPSARWRMAVEKTEKMRDEGWPIDMTMVLSEAVERLLSSDPESIAEGLGISKGPAPAPMRRRPYRTEAAS